MFLSIEFPSYVNLDDRRSLSPPITPVSFSEAPEKIRSLKNFPLAFSSKF
ncbi:MAG: hypothetical protein MGF17_00545 [Trichodesmium sp. MAG_R04]|nr:hypothetical protein [Trichodesmium sp. MAG_R04]